MNVRQKIAMLLLSVCAVAAHAQSTEDKLKKLIEPRLGGEAKIQSVTKTPYAGLYEIQSDGDILYADETGKYLFVGRVVDAQTYKDYTKERVDEINKVAFADFPLDKAIKIVKGNGKRQIIVFEDPNCGYCKRFHQNLKDVNNITVYTFPYNILSQDSIEKSRNIVCSANPAKAWTDWMVNGKAAPNAPASCKGTNEEVLALGQKLRVTGTPTIFFTDGTRAPGALPAKDLEAKLATIK